MTDNKEQTPKSSLICAAIVLALALALYAFTLAPTVTLVDSGELIVAARTLGVAHPPGFPLYVLLAHAATLFPVGNVAARVNFASAIFASLAAALLVLLMVEALLAAPQSVTPARTPEKKKGREKKGKQPPASADVAPEANNRWLMTVIPATFAGLLLAFSRTLWSYATIAEVYTLNTLLIIVIFFLMLRWRRLLIEKRSAASHQEDRWLYAAAGVFGLALGAHHVTIGLTLPALAVLALLTQGVGFFKGKRLVYAALFAFAGVAIYLYLPLAASRSPVMNWGDPASLQRFWWHVTGRQYQVFFDFDPKRMINQGAEFFELLFREFGPWWLPLAPLLALAGFIFLLRRDRVMLWFLMLTIAGNLLYALNYEIAEDKDAYYLPTYVSIALAAGFGARWLFSWLQPRNLPSKPSRAFAAAALIVISVIALVSNYPYNDRSKYFIAKDYVANTLSTVDTGGLLLTQDWQIYSPMLYFQEVERARRDVVSIDVSLLRRSWYFDYLSRAYPELIERSREPVNAFLETLRRWEQDPEIFNRDVTLNQRINTQFYDMIMSFVTTHIESAPVYITQDVAADLGGQNAELTRRLGEKYAFVPQGLVFQLMQDRAFHEPASPPLLTRGLTDGTLRFEVNDVVKLKVFPVYVGMLINRGRYLAAYKRHEQAIEAYNQALALDPDNRSAKQFLGESRNALRAAQSPGS